MDWGDELAPHAFLSARNGDALGHRTDSHACCRLLDLLAYVRRSESRPFRHGLRDERRYAIFCHRIGCRIIQGRRLTEKPEHFGDFAITS